MKNERNYTLELVRCCEEQGFSAYDNLFKLYEIVLELQKNGKRT